MYNTLVAEWALHRSLITAHVNPSECAEKRGEHAGVRPAILRLNFGCGLIGDLIEPAGINAVYLSAVLNILCAML